MSRFHPSGPFRSDNRYGGNDDKLGTPVDPLPPVSFLAGGTANRLFEREARPMARKEATRSRPSLSGESPARRVTGGSKSGAAQLPRSRRPTPEHGLSARASLYGETPGRCRGEGAKFADTLA